MAREDAVFEFCQIRIRMRFPQIWTCKICVFSLDFRAAECVCRVSLAREYKRFFASQSLLSKSNFYAAFPRLRDENPCVKREIAIE